MPVISKVRERFTETAVDDEIVIMRLDNGDFFSLSGSAAAAWRLIDGSRDRAALVSALAETFATDEEEVARDVDAFLAQLRETGLLADD